MKAPSARRAEELRRALGFLFAPLLLLIFSATPAYAAEGDTQPSEECTVLTFHLDDAFTCGMGKLFSVDQTKVQQLQTTVGSIGNKVPFAYVTPLYAFMQNMAKTDIQTSDISNGGFYTTPGFNDSYDSSQYCLASMCISAYGLQTDFPVVGRVTILPNQRGNEQLWNAAGQYRPIVIWAEYILIAVVIGGWAVSVTMPRLGKEG